MKQALPTFYFSLRSPYSWLALHDLRQTAPQLLASLRLAPFWEPDAAYQAQLASSGQAFLYRTMSREKHLYILRDIKRLAARRGLEPRWPLDYAPHWEVPHLAWIVADAAGKGLEFLERATLARWQEGLDICTPQVIADIATALDLDADVLKTAHTSQTTRDAGYLCLRSCIDAGVFGVPFFTIGRNTFWGIDRLPDFLGAIDSMQRPVTSDEIPPGSAPPTPAIFDHAGGCG